jgi:hypothetical protein
MPGWRDLSISQYRRIKGDAQLSQTYAMSAAAAAAAAGLTPSERYNTCSNSGNSRHPWAWPGGWGDAASPLAAAAATGDPSSSGDAAAAAAAAAIVPPHHISNEPMSELSYAIYMARRLPVELLVSLVRRSFRPAEYPASIEVLFHSSPDEALPQFYTDPKVGRPRVGRSQCVYVCMLCLQLHARWLLLLCWHCFCLLLQCLKAMHSHCCRSTGPLAAALCTHAMLLAYVHSVSFFAPHALSIILSSPAVVFLAQVFQSRHADMPDLAVPDWAADADEFVRLHR